MDEILVSINCITYNHEKYIAEAIESFLMQVTDFKYEVLIHDDASTDRTAEIIKEYEKKYPEIIKPILQKENQYSKGVKRIDMFNYTRAEGKYIAMCEGDDYWTDQYKLQKQIDYMESHPQCSMCFHASELIRVGKGRIGAVKPYDSHCISPTEDIILGDGGFIATSSIVYRKEVLKDPPAFYLNAPVGDYPLQILTSTKEYAYYINEFMSVYRLGVEGSWTSILRSGKDTVEKEIKNRRCLIDMLNELNQYTDEKYSNTISKKILIYEFGILKLEKKTKQLKQRRYKKLYNALSRKEKIKLHVKCYLPFVYFIYKVLKNIIKRKHKAVSQRYIGV